MDKTLSQYAGQCVAFVDDKIIASGKTQLEVYKQAKHLYPRKMVSLMRVPRKDEVITFL